jgi:hypothetical protein
MAAFNVNAARAQRREAAGGTTWEFSIDGGIYTLPRELPHTTVKALAKTDDNDIETMMRLLLGDAQYDRFATHDLTLQDIEAILTAYGKQTGLSLGED